MALWLCSYVAMWLYGDVAMWLCGYVDQFHNFKFLNFKDPKSWVHTWSRFFEFFESHISKDNIFPGCSQIFLEFLKVSRCPQRQIMLVLGLGDGFKNQEIMKFGVLGL